MEPNAIGHNNPPSDAEILRDRLAAKHQPMLKRADDLIAAADRVPGECTDDETAGKIGDLIKIITGTHKALEAERVSEKEPFLSQGRAVDGFFKFSTDKLAAAKAKVQRPLDGFLKRKADEERRQREETARIAREEAQRREQEAMALATANKPEEAEVALDTAVRVDQNATRMEQQAQAKPAELAQSRGVQGSLASLRTRWVGEIIDRDQLNLELLRAHLPMDGLQKAVNSFVSAGGRELRGANIFEKSEAVVR